MRQCDTYTATISLGLKEGYDGKIHSLYEVENICQQYCDETGYGVTITPTKFIYTDGSEDGCLIGLINYPRFHSKNEEVVEHAIKIAKLCMKTLWQQRISIICSRTTCYPTDIQYEYFVGR